MKGVIFTEFLELVETGFSLNVADKVITKACPFHSAFTSVGKYDYRDLIAMVEQLSHETSLPASALVNAFGKHLFQYFLASNPEAFLDVQSTSQLLQKVERVIHGEVLKIHPDAELPSFRFPSSSDGHFAIEYVSSRPFATLACGLIEASIEYFKESYSIERTDLEGPPGTHALFRLIPTHEG